MSKAIEIALNAYLEVVQREFNDGKRDVGSNESMRLLLTEDQLLVRLVERVEQRAEFEALIRVTAQELRPEEEAAPAGLRSEVETYLRLSGLYRRAFSGDLPMAKNVAGDYVRAFNEEQQRITYLAPIQFVTFATDSLDCGAFQIRRFQPAELDALLRNEARRLFYSWAHVDTERLAEHWFVCVTGSIPRRKAGMVGFIFALEWSSPASSPSLPGDVPWALRLLALCDWQRYQSSATPEIVELIAVGGRAILARPRIPFAIAASESLTAWPQACPDASAFGTDVQDGIYKFRMDFGDAFCLDATQTEEFSAFMRSVAELVARVESVGQRWLFINTALEFLWRGFACEGVEQLLWNITAIEAVFGEKVTGLNSLLRSRLVSILAPSKGDPKELKRRFNELYDRRSRYIHGGEGGSVSSPQILLSAREFARSAVLWMLHYLGHVHDHLQDHEAPGREALLQVLDMDEEQRRDVANVISVLPECFPKIPDWLD
jgi:hypothetical protein